MDQVSKDKSEDKKKYKLRDYVNTFSGGTPISTESKYYSGKINFIASGEIGQNHTAKKINDEAISKSSAKLVQQGDILYAMYGATAGQIAITPISGAINQAILCIRPNQKLDKMYLYFQLEFMKSKILNHFIQGGQGNLSGGQILNLDIIKPALEKQIKYSSLLSSIDKLIELEENLLKSCNDKLLYERKKITKSDTNSKRRKIGEFLYIPDKVAVKSVDSSKILRLSLYLKGLKSISEDNTLQDGGTKYYCRKSGDFIFGKQNIFKGSMAIIPDEFDGYYSSGDVPTLRFKSNIDPDYFMNIVTEENFYSGLENFANGSGSKRLHEKEFLNMQINLNEDLSFQKSIGQYLKLCDEVIIMRNELIENLKQQKKYYLNQIFIIKGE